jgi:hypothetical protein
MRFRRHFSPQKTGAGLCDRASEALNSTLTAADLTWPHGFFAFMILYHHPYAAVSGLRLENMQVSELRLAPCR